MRPIPNGKPFADLQVDFSSEEPVILHDNQDESGSTLDCE